MYEVEQTYNPELDKLLKYNITPDDKTYSLIDSSEERAVNRKKAKTEGESKADDIKIKKKFDFAAADAEPESMGKDSEKTKPANSNADKMDEESLGPSKFGAQGWSGGQNTGSEVFDGGAKSKLPNSFGIMNMPHGSSSNLDVGANLGQANLYNPGQQVYYPGPNQTPNVIKPSGNNQAPMIPSNTGYNPLMPTGNLLQPNNDPQESTRPGIGAVVGENQNLDSAQKDSKLEASGLDSGKKDSNNPFEQDGEEDNADLDELLEIFRKSDPEAIKN